MYGAPFGQIIDIVHYSCPMIRFVIFYSSTRYLLETQGNLISFLQEKQHRVCIIERCSHIVTHLVSRPSLFRVCVNHLHVWLISFITYEINYLFFMREMKTVSHVFMLTYVEHIKLCVIQMMQTYQSSFLYIYCHCHYVIATAYVMFIPIVERHLLENIINDEMINQS